MLHDAHVSEYVEVLFSDFSDYFKSLYGCRPRHHVERTVSGLMQALDELDAAAPGIYAQEEADTQAAIAALEELIARQIDMGAKDRATAIAWLDQAYETCGDMDYLCYHLDVPYGYLAA